MLPLQKNFDLWAQTSDALLPKGELFSQDFGSKPSGNAFLHINRGSKPGSAGCYMYIKTFICDLKVRTLLPKGEFFSQDIGSKQSGNAFLHINGKLMSIAGSHTDHVLQFIRSEF